MYSVLTLKATRTPKIIEIGLSSSDAIAKASDFYDKAKIFSDHDLLVSGVSIVVMEDSDAAKAVEAGTLSLGVPLVYQCGGY